MLNEKIKRFCISFRTLRIFWDQKLNMATFEEEDEGRSEKKKLEKNSYFYFQNVDEHSVYQCQRGYRT